MLRYIVDIPAVSWLVKTGVQILLGEIRIFVVQQVNQFEISSKCHLIDDTLQHLCNSGHCHHQDGFNGGCLCCISPAVEIYGSATGGGALNYVFAVDTIPVPH